jgi:hypothetical protein
MIGSSHALVSPGVLVGENGGPLERVGELHKDGRGRPRALPYMSRDVFSGDVFGSASLAADNLPRFDQRCPSTL